MRIFKLTVAYDGGDFVGWQRQATGDSVQGLLETALAVLEGARVVVHGAGRTDAGVHAFGQVASVALECRHEPATIARAVNAHLPPAIRVLACVEAGPDFHARFSATGKTYRYLMRNGPSASPFELRRAWHLTETLDLGAMREAAAALEGTHDFAAFRSTGTDTTTTVRTIHRSQLLDVAAEPPHPAWPGRVLAYEVRGDGFLRHMVRAIVGTLVEVGRGARDTAAVHALLQGGCRAEAGPTAPAHGLYLVSVDYD